jgi:hypothetical protein
MLGEDDALDVGSRNLLKASSGVAGGGSLRRRLAAAGQGQRQEDQGE